MSAIPLNLVLNPSAKIYISDQASSPCFQVEAPIVGSSLSSVRVCAENLPRAHAFLRSILIDGNKNAQISEQDAVELRQIGLFAPADALPQAVEYQFPLRDSDSVQSHTIMDIAADRPAHPCAMRLPAEWSQQVLQFESHHHGSVWAPVLLAAGAEKTGHRDTKPVVTQSEMALDDQAIRAQFKREGFATLENLLPAEHVTALGAYFQALAAQGFLSIQEDRGSKRFTAHNHPVANFWHDQLNERVAQLAGQRTKPSYSFVSLYIEGGDLFWHTDRSPCEYTITLLLDYAPLDADSRSPWALKVKGRDGITHSLHLRVGEALILKGRELVHGREVLPDGHRSASLLFHFVNEDFAGELG